MAETPTCEELQKRVEELENKVLAWGHTEEIYRVQVEHSLQGLIIIQDAHIVFANPSFAEMSGYTINELLSLSPDEVRAMISPDDQDLVWGRFQARMEGKDVQPRYEYRGIRKDGTLRWFELVASRIDFRGKSAIQGAVVDITYRKLAEEALEKSEEQYRSLFDRLPIGVFRSTPDGRYIDANPAFMKLLGCPDLKTLLSTPVTQFYRDPEQREQWKRLAEEGEESFAMELQYQKLDGTPLWLRETARVVRDSYGNVQYYEGVAEDITEIKRKEEEQEHIEAQLQHAQRMEAIGTLAGGIAHDFNNILSAIIGYTEIALLHHPSESSAARKNLEQVLAAGERAKDLVKQILAFSRQAEEEHRPVLLEPLVKEGIKLLRATLPSTIKIHQSIMPHAGLVMADPIQIHQVLMNLCTNAYHAMREQGGVLEIRLEPTTLNTDEAGSHNLSSGAYLALSVIDTGCGMSPDVVNRIFDPYFTTKEKGVGTGLGLAVVHGIVKSHGGTMTFSSEPGKGSTFIVYLPLLEEAKRLEEAHTEEALPTGDERILFIDDEPMLADLGEQMLQRLGYRVVTKTSSTEALELVRNAPHEFDLIITDQTMPHMTGDELAKELMNLRPSMPIILCTGFSEKITEQEANAMGLRAFLLKPLVISHLAKTIRNILDEK